MNAQMTDTWIDTLYAQARREAGLPARSQRDGIVMRAPTLDAACRDLPTQTAILGVCEDGLPLLLDLHDPAPGSLLVVSGSLPEARGVLQQAAASACLTSSRHQVQVAVISQQPYEWERCLAGVSVPEQLLGVHAPHSLEARERILALARLGNSRLLGRLQQPPILLLLDDLAWVAAADHELQVHLRWLLENGPEMMIWSIASLQEWAALEMRAWLPRFGTRVFGAVQQALAKALGAPPAMAYGAARGNGIFELKTRDGWTRFALADHPA